MGDLHDSSSEFRPRSSNPLPWDKHSQPWMRATAKKTKPAAAQLSHRNIKNPTTPAPTPVARNFSQFANYTPMEALDKGISEREVKDFLTHMNDLLAQATNDSASPGIRAIALLELKKYKETKKFADQEITALLNNITNEDHAALIIDVLNSKSSHSLNDEQRTEILLILLQPCLRDARIQIFNTLLKDKSTQSIVLAYLGRNNYEFYKFCPTSSIHDAKALSEFQQHVDQLKEQYHTSFDRIEKLKLLIQLLEYKDNAANDFAINELKDPNFNGLPSGAEYKDEKLKATMEAFINAALNAEYNDDSYSSQRVFDLFFNHIQVIDDPLIRNKFLMILAKKDSRMCNIVLDDIQCRITQKELSNIEILDYASIIYGIWREINPTPEHKKSQTALDFSERAALIFARLELPANLFPGLGINPTNEWTAAKVQSSFGALLHNVNQNYPGSKEQLIRLIEETGKMADGKNTIDALIPSIVAINEASTQDQTEDIIQLLVVAFLAHNQLKPTTANKKQAERWAQARLLHEGRRSINKANHPDISADEKIGKLIKASNLFAALAKRGSVAGLKHLRDTEAAIAQLELETLKDGQTKGTVAGNKTTYEPRSERLGEDAKIFGKWGRFVASKPWAYKWFGAR